MEGKRIALFFPEWKKTIKAMVQAAAGDPKVEEKPAIKVAEAGTRKAPNKTGAKMTAGKKPAAKVGKVAPPKGKAPAPKKTGAKATGGIKKK